jgi:NADPH:quinone reductase-like Zn-dependent oxidoreductase
VAVDRRAFPDLALPARARGVDRERLARHQESSAAFQALIDDLSDGHGVAVLVDNIGEPLHKATTRALARQGVVTTCGWKAGMRIAHLRGAACIARQLHVNTHVWRLPDSPVIRDVQEATGWIAPAGSTTVADFDAVPALAADYAAGRIDSYFPLYRVNHP